MLDERTVRLDVFGSIPDDVAEAMSARFESLLVEHADRIADELRRAFPGSELETVVD